MISFRIARLTLLLLTVIFIDSFQTAEAVHLRVQETSITENGRVHSEPDVRLKTKGYGLTYIFPIGLGVAYTQLETHGEHESAEGKTLVALDHSYVDIVYTGGERWLATVAYGVGIAGKSSVNGQDSKKFSATAWSLGVGYRLAAFEIYWINRLNFPRYENDGATLNVTSTHYQLGLGLYLP